jgi:hypothetical protein
MAKNILSKTALKDRKKTTPKLKKPTPASAPSECQKPEEASIPLYRSELFTLHDITEEIKLLRDIARESPEMQIIQVEILIKRTARDSWNLIHEKLDDRWQEVHPDVDLIRND